MIGTLLLKESYIWLGKGQRKRGKNVSKSFCKTTASNDESLFPEKKHWLKLYHFPQRFLEAKCTVPWVSAKRTRHLPCSSAASFGGFYPRASFRPCSSLLLTPDTRQTPRSPCPDDTNRLWWCRAKPTMAISDGPFITHPRMSEKRHSGISLMLTLKPPLSTLQLFPLFWLPPTCCPPTLNRGWTTLC